MGDRRKRQTIRIAILTLLVLMGLWNISNAMDTQFQVQSQATYSDNINRLPKGEELSGYLVTLEGDMDISGKVGSGTFDLNAGGGWETLDDGEPNNADNYRFRLNVVLPWSETGHLGGLVSGSEARAEPKVSDINQVRVRTRLREKRVEIGKRLTPNLKWLVALNNNTERRFDRDLSETETEFDWEITLSRRSSLFIDLGITDGKEEIDDVTWTGNSAVFDARKQQDRLTAGGYRLDWQDQKLEKADGSSQRTYKLGFLAYYNTRMVSGWLFASNLGMDVIKPPLDDRRWEPRASISLEGAPERVFRAKGEMSLFITIQDPVESQVAWTRDSQGLFGLVWRVTRKYTVEPSVQYRIAEVFGNNTSDRTDKSSLMRVATTWTPFRDWSVELNGQTEDRSSTQATFDLVENKLELKVTATFM